MEKAKAYIKSEMRKGGSSHVFESSPQQQRSPASPHVGNRELQPQQCYTTSTAPHSQYATSHCYQQHHSQLQHQRRDSPYRQTQHSILSEDSSADVVPLCYVCGGPGGYEPVRIRTNYQRSTEPYFPFLERHEPPKGVPQVAVSQNYVTTCMLCYVSLNEQWKAYEREKRPHSQRIYHMKRVDGKGYIGADITTQGEYAAQMLGLGSEYLVQTGSSGDVGGSTVHSYNMERSHYYAESPHLVTISNTSRNDSPSPALTSRTDYFSSRNSPLPKTVPYDNRPQSRDANNSHQQLSSPHSRCSSLAAPNTVDNLNIKLSSYAHHKFKLGQLNNSTTLAHNNYHNYNIPLPILEAHHHSMQFQQQQQNELYFHAQANKLNAQHPASSPEQVRNATIPSTSQQQNHQQQCNQQQHTPVPGPFPLDFPSNPRDDDVLDLRNANVSRGNNSMSPLRQSSSTSALISNQQDQQEKPFNIYSISNCAMVEVGILDLSMPDKNSVTEVCYACGEEQRRGSLIEISIMSSSTKDTKEEDVPCFPIFNDKYPRPARSRPVDPRGMIQACRQCYDHLMKQWYHYKNNQTPENERTYYLRKKMVSMVERAKFVCYTCGLDTLSSQLSLVYCCPNAEREPYYPFIKIMTAFKNASPISPQGMVQICSTCYEKHSSRAEGVVQTKKSATTVAYNNNSNAVSGMGITEAISGDKNFENNSNHLKSLRHSDSRSSTPTLQQQSSAVNSPLTSASTSSCILQQQQLENGYGQYPCCICKTMYASNKMEWLSTTAEHMNSHAMHFPCLKVSKISNSQSCRDSTMSNNGGNNNDSNGSRVLACKNCANHLARQWETLDAERVPLEHRRYNVPSSIINSTSPNGSRHGIGNINTSPLTSSVTSTLVTTTSIYCFLCGLHSDLTLARVLYASKEGSRPYFPFFHTHNTLSNAEQLRKDMSALVCTFCFHSLVKQWRKYESQGSYVKPNDRKYNWHDYICHLCGITTYRKRVRALPVNDFPFLKNRKNDDGLLLENGEYAVICLDCYESLRQQASQHERFGVPISKRAYNWVPQPPPPEDSPDVSVARLPCGERSDRLPVNNNIRPISNSSIKAKNSSPKIFDKTREVPPKPCQKRSATSPVPVVASPHSFQPSSVGSSMEVSGNSINVLSTTPTPKNASMAANLLNHNLSSSHLGAHSPSLTQQHQHQSHQQAVAAVAAAAQVQQQMVVGVPPTALNTAAARGPFASALRNLAKQADIKEEEEISGRDRNERSSIISIPTSVSTTSNVALTPSVRTALPNERLVSSSANNPTAEERLLLVKKRSVVSSPPAEKIPRLNPIQTTSVQPELLARSGFQPYRSDERLMHPAGAFPLEAYSPFAGLPGLSSNAFLNPASLPYSEQMYLDQRFQLLRSAGAHSSHAHALYPPIAPPYASHLYSMLPAAALSLGPTLHERIKLEEEHRVRLAREEERERELQREKERELREQREMEKREREKQQREREQREKEQREREQKEKEAREREVREKEREARERERQQILSASHHYSNQLYNPLNRNLLGSMIPHLNLSLRGPSSALHGLPGMAPYHVGTNHRQSPHGTMGLNMGIPGLTGMPTLSHVPPNMSHHLQQAALGLTHAATASITHPSFSAATLGRAHQGLNLTHPQMSPHQVAITSNHQLSQPSASLMHTTTASTSPSGGSSTNISNTVNNSTGVSLRFTEPNSSSITSSTATIPVTAVDISNGSASYTTPMSLSSHIPSIYYAHHSSHLAAIHTAAVATPLTSSVTIPSTLPPLSIGNATNPVIYSTNGGKLGSSAVSPSNLNLSLSSANVQSSNGNENSNRSIRNPNTLRHHIVNVLPQASGSGNNNGKTTATGVPPQTHEPTTLDLTGSNSNSSNHAPSTISNADSTCLTSNSNAQPISYEVNGVNNIGFRDESIRETMDDHNNKTKNLLSNEKQSPSEIAPSPNPSTIALDTLKRSPPEEIVTPQCSTAAMSDNGQEANAAIEAMPQHSPNNQNHSNVSPGPGKRPPSAHLELLSHKLEATRHSPQLPTVQTTEHNLQQHQKKTQLVSPLKQSVKPTTCGLTCNTITTNSNLQPPTTLPSPSLFTQNSGPSDKTTDQKLPYLTDSNTTVITDIGDDSQGNSGGDHMSLDNSGTTGVTSTTSGNISPPVVSSTTNVTTCSPHTTNNFGEEFNPHLDNKASTISPKNHNKCSSYSCLV